MEEDKKTAQEYFEEWLYKKVDFALTETMMWEGTTGNGEYWQGYYEALELVRNRLERDKFFKEKK